MTSLLTLNTQQLEGLYAVAHGLLDAGRVVEAVHAFRVMVRFSPTDERGWLGLAKCHQDLGDDEVATELLGAGSLVSSPRSARCLVALARIRAHEGDRRAAAELLDEARNIAEETDASLLPVIISERETGR
jgi:Flp pilus assembly protein TadD